MVIPFNATVRRLIN
ncbi:BnaA04g21570D [Brassica napus]|uniref:BnaA04g21570D protein n=1 Tax=Brassica napus TaxID=3708 RepID=A0A078FVG9_BRANA|nr:BnaA04g21570D [Brassica napus]